MPLMNKHLRSLVLSAVASAFLLPAVQAEGSEAPTVKVSSGAIVGIVTNAAKLPVAGATVTATRTDGGAIRATISGSDGIYSFADLAPGTWSVTVQVDGYPDSTAPSLQVVASKATRHDMVMNVPAAAPSTSPSVAAAQPSTSPPLSAAMPPATSPAREPAV